MGGSEEEMTPGTGSHNKENKNSNAGWTQVLFQIEAPVAFGDTVFVVGSTKALGSWDIKRGIELSTGSDTFPIWRSCLVYLRTGTSIEYKFVVRHGDGSYEWENSSEPCRNRRCTFVGGRLLLKHVFSETRELLEVVPLESAWAGCRPCCVKRALVPREAAGRSWRANGQHGRVLFRRLGSTGVEYLLQHHIETDMLSLPGAFRIDSDVDSRYTAFRGATETVLGEELTRVGWHCLYEAFKCATVDLLSVKLEAVGVYVVDVQELTEGLPLRGRLSQSWSGSTGTHTKSNVCTSVFPNGCIWVPVRILTAAIRASGAPTSRDRSAVARAKAADAEMVAFLQGVEVHPDTTRMLRMFKQKLW
eukprot:CAMPEP_0114539058 /NCGR_PEP_ID=MMETSP0114-20121206/37_1 /TAXON_ID=31324 /ORGANISM="Goniomonas sp, Strain m" /LENGTH=360 /DNA_ID=CAMNT_0001723139 /DNA_START=27 /DNA_END=1106 /DNA_ORIENTATION=+